MKSVIVIFSLVFLLNNLGFAQSLSGGNIPTPNPQSEAISPNATKKIFPLTPMPSTSELQPFGANLFLGHFSDTYHDGLNSSYEIMPGDRIELRVWGAKQYDAVLIVDAQGNIFLPEVGPIHVSGVKNSDLNSTVRNRVLAVYTKNVEIYANLMNAQPVAVFVTGYVLKPGRYAGGPIDSVLFFLDRAGGIEPSKGSYRVIKVLRRNKVVAEIDLYTFIRDGILKSPRLQNEDVILVEEKRESISVEGQVFHDAIFELTKKQTSGAELSDLVSLKPDASHVSVSGVRNNAPYHRYISVEDFKSFVLEDGDKVRFLADVPYDTIMISAKGAITGDSHFPIKKKARLTEVLRFVPVDQDLANLDGIYIQRKSVAQSQKRSLEESLHRLEQSVLTATSSSEEEAAIRAKEAELITNFIQRAKTVEPEGTVVVSSAGEIKDIILENGDMIVIPLKSDLILISGEVMIPKAIVYEKNKSVNDYIRGCGGFTDRADQSNILIVKPNGEILDTKRGSLGPGDQIFVLPVVETKSLQLTKDISQILYQIAIATRVILLL